MLKGEQVTQETSGMSKGEWREFEGVNINQSAATRMVRSFFSPS
jgi:hypothetical protein